MLGVNIDVFHFEFTRTKRDRLIVSVVWELYRFIPKLIPSKAVQNGHCCMKHFATRGGDEVQDWKRENVRHVENSECLLDVDKDRELTFIISPSIFQFTEIGGRGKCNISVLN